MIYRFQRILYSFCLLLFVFSPFVSDAQVAEQGKPIYAEHPNWVPTAISKMPQKNLAPLDKKQLETEDAQQINNLRFAAPISTSISLENDGLWTTLPDAGRVWHLAVSSKDALGLIFYFEKMLLPVGAHLFAFTPDGKYTEGKFTAKSNTPQGAFTIGVIYGDEVILELYEPADQIGKTVWELNRVDYAYNDELLFAPADDADMFGFGQSSNCQTNINCPPGDAWQTAKKGIARIQMALAQGTGWCSGSLMANTAQTRTEYFLSAYHCIHDYTPWYWNWKFYFDYEAVDCPDPVFEPTTFHTIVGCEQRSGWIETDFLLLELNAIPDYYDVYYNGWNRAPGSLPAKSAMIHHPAGDIMKISKENDSVRVFAQNINWGNFISGVWTHYQVEFDTGYFQPGSSGAPLFDGQQRIIGQLHGGDYDPANPCQVGSAYFGRLSLSWANTTVDSSNQLAPWLDSLGTGAYFTNGYVPEDPNVDIAGRVRTYNGSNMEGVRVELTGDAQRTQWTDATGAYSFNNLEPGSYAVECIKDSLDLNGVNTFDILDIRKFLLGLITLGPWEIVAGDVTNDNHLNTFDLNELSKLSLGLQSGFSQSDSWRFYKANHIFDDPTFPFSDMPVQKIIYLNLNNDALNTNFWGVKIGDVTGDAKPNMR